MKTQNQNQTLMWSVREHRTEMMCYKQDSRYSVNVKTMISSREHKYANRVSS